VLRLWDSLFADDHRPDFLLFFACAAVILQRDKLLSEGFSENMSLLQNYPPTDVALIIRKATELRDTADPDALEPENLSKAVVRAMGGPREATADEMLRAELASMEADILRRSRGVASKPVPIPNSSRVEAATAGSRERKPIPGALPPSLFQ